MVMCQSTQSTIVSGISLVLKPCIIYIYVYIICVGQFPFISHEVTPRILGIPGHWATPQSLRQARSPRLSHALMTWPGPGKLHEIAFEALKNGGVQHQKWSFTQPSERESWLPNMRCSSQKWVFIHQILGVPDQT